MDKESLIRSIQSADPMATKLLMFKAPGTKVYFGVPELQAKATAARKKEYPVEKIEKSLDHVLGIVSGIGKSFRGAFEKSGADSASLQLGLQFTAGGTIFVVEASASAMLNVTLSFEKTK